MTSASVELLQTGLRVSELARLRLGDAEIPPKILRPNKARNDPGTVGAVHVQGKGRKARTVPLNWKACKAITAYRDARPAIEEAGRSRPSSAGPSACARSRTSSTSA